MFRNKSIKVDLKTTIPLFNNNNLRDSKGSKEYPIKIINSNLGNISIKEGCKIINSICTGNIELDRFTSINGPGTRISSRINKIKIGAFTSIASNVIIQEDYHRYDRVSTYFMSQNIFKDNVRDDVYSKGDIIIEEDVWIGSNSVVLSGVTIGRGSIIGAGSIVTKDIPRYSIVAGNPAKIIKKRFPKHIEEYLEDIKWWNLSTVDILRNKELFLNPIDEYLNNEKEVN